MEMIMGRYIGYYTGTLMRSLVRFNNPNNLFTRCLCRCEFRRHESYGTRQQRSLSSNYHAMPISILSQTRHAALLLYKGSLVAPYSSDINKPPISGIKPLNIFQKMKQLTKDYWHVLIPVHLVTSIGWLIIFYTTAKNGVDIISLMEYFHMPEKYVNMIRNSSAQHAAVTYALYKIFTPLRYTVTVGGTTMSIKYLDKRGYLKFNRPATQTQQSGNSSSVCKEKTPGDKKMDGKE